MATTTKRLDVLEAEALRLDPTFKPGVSAGTGPLPWVVPGPGPGPGPVPGPAPVSAYPPPTTTIQVLDSIDRTGATDIAVAMTNWLNGIPQATATSRKAIDLRGGTFRYDQAITPRNRTAFDFIGSPGLERATFRQGGSITNENGSAWYTQWGQNNLLRFRGIDVIGNCPAPAADKGLHAAAGFLLDGGDGAELYDVSVRNVWGDGIELNSHIKNVHAWNLNLVSGGRNAIAVIMADNALIEAGVSGKDWGYCVFDIEPNETGQDSSKITWRNWTLNGYWYGHVGAFSAEGADGAIIDGVTIDGITAVGVPLWFVSRKANRKNYNISNLRSDTPAGLIPFDLQNVAGLRLAVPTISQPLAAGVQLARTTGSTNIVLV